MATSRKSWFIRSGRYVEGPISSVDLQQLARAGRLKPDANISQSPEGPWRTARQLKGLVFPEPELPPLGKQVPFDSFADSASPAPLPDAGVLLENPNAAPPRADEPEPELVFDAAPPPTAARTEPVPVPSFTAPVTDFFSRRTKSAEPEYAVLAAYGWLFRIAGAVLIALGVLGFFGALVSLFWIEADSRGPVLSAGAAGLLGGLLTGFLILIPGDAILAFVDLVRDARRQRIAAERTAALLEEAFSRPGETAADRDAADDQNSAG